MPEDIHDRIVAGLEELRTAYHTVGAIQPEDTLIDMAIDNVRRWKCPGCGDTGLHHQLVTCDCGRPAYLAECERRLKGEKR